MTVQVVTDLLRTTVFKLELSVLILSALHTSYFTIIFLKIKTFPLNLKILCLYLSVPIYCNIVTRIWIITSYLWIPELQNKSALINSIHSASIAYFEINIIWIVLERTLSIRRSMKSTVLSPKIVTLSCCVCLILFHLLLIYLSYSSIFIGVRMTYFVFVTNLICFGGFVLLNKLYRNYYKRTLSANLNTRYNLVESIRICRTMIFLSCYSLILFTPGVIYMNLWDDFAIASNFIDLAMAIFGLLFPFVFALTHPEVNKKFFNFPTKRINAVQPTNKTTLKTTLEGRNLIVDSSKEGQLYFEQLRNQWN